MTNTLFCMHFCNILHQVRDILPGESLAAVWADIRFFYPTLMRAHMVAHAVLSLKRCWQIGQENGFSSEWDRRWRLR